MNVVIKEAWPTLATATLTDQVYTVLRDRILAGDVSPGEFIREQEVSDAAGVSRTPVRDALGRLASEGFLERIAHRGFRVPEESITDLLELYPILGTLEVLAGGESFPRLEAMRDELRDTVRRLETWTFTTDRRDWARSIAEHAEILLAIEERDFKAAIETLRRNRLMTYRRFRGSILAPAQPNDSPRSIRGS
ncbi:MAG TPA: GntR family transcriptional regulator [Acidobacteriota bacterium]|nr:GntR family transcriptional regulator [Acidobacteriota bacterium]